MTSLGSTTASVQRQTASKGSARGVQAAHNALAAAVTPASSLLQDTAPRHSVLLGALQTGAVAKPGQISVLMRQTGGHISVSEWPTSRTASNKYGLFQAEQVGEKLAAGSLFPVRDLPSPMIT